MKDYVFVTFGNEDLFIKKAEEFGYSELVLCYILSEAKKLTVDKKDKLEESTGLKLFFAIIKETKSFLVKKNLFDKQIGLGTSLISSFRGLTDVYNNEFGKEKDAIHQRRSGLNHTVLKEFKEKKINILFSVKDFIKTSEEQKAIILGRVKQNIKACRRAETSYLLVSLAEEVNEMISISDLKSLRKVLDQPN